RLKVDETSYTVLRRLIVATVYTLGFVLVIYTLPELRSISTAIFASAGFAGIVIGFAAQGAISNIISGVFLAVFQPIRVGDYVTFRDEYGRVTDITLRHTVITTWDNRRFIVPNSVMNTESIINWSIEDPTVLWYVDLGISYDSDIDLARRIMVEEMEKHPDTLSLLDIKRYHPEVEEAYVVRLVECGDFALVLRMYFWVRDRSLAFGTGCEILEAVKKRFDAEGVEIPFPYRTIVYKRELPQPARLETP
ncbi:MAG: mechanosensitive ion channel family protein, partial [Mariprofundales bacterium]|nr:mechanosensitive ion channel family protein [Mariprofundales bacterium]